MEVKHKILVISLILILIFIRSRSCGSEEKLPKDDKTKDKNLPANNVPVLVNLPNSLNISENSDFGLSVFQVIVTDEDVTDNLTCNITGEGAEFFNIDPTICNVSTSAMNVLDFESIVNSTIVVNITVSDGKDEVFGYLTVNITDQNEAPEFPQLSYTIYGDEGKEKEPLTLTNFNISDPEGETLRFEMDCGINNGSFSMNQSNGEVKFTASYDLDSKTDPSTVSCVVIATDGILSASTSLTISINPVNEFDPVFHQPTYTFTVLPDTNASTIIGAVSATDLDTGPHGNIKYTISQLSANGTYFSISSTGEIYLQQEFPNNTEIGDVFNIQVIATDGGGRNSSAVVFIVVSGPTTPKIWSSVPLTGRYITFWDDSRNISWVTLVICFSVIGACVVVYIFCNFFGSSNYVVMRTPIEKRPTVTVIDQNVISGSSGQNILVHQNYLKINEMPENMKPELCLPNFDVVLQCLDVHYQIYRMKTPSSIPRVEMSENVSVLTCKESFQPQTPRALHSRDDPEYRDRFF